MLDVTLMVSHELYNFGTEEQKQKWLPNLVQGEELGAFGLSGLDAGSDAGATRTTAGSMVMNALSMAPSSLFPLRVMIIAHL